MDRAVRTKLTQKQEIDCDRDCTAGARLSLDPQNRAAHPDYLAAHFPLTEYLQLDL
jgi:hypothetical protein